jgi:hypothetical protein
MLKKMSIAFACLITIIYTSKAQIQLEQPAPLSKFEIQLNPGFGANKNNTYIYGDWLVRMFVSPKIAVKGIISTNFYRLKNGDGFWSTHSNQGFGLGMEYHFDAERKGPYLSTSYIKNSNLRSLQNTFDLSIGWRLRLSKRFSLVAEVGGEYNTSKNHNRSQSQVRLKNAIGLVYKF